MTTIANLRKIVNEWGAWFAAEHDTSCKWTDLYAENPDMKQYQERRLTLDVGPAILNLVPTQPQPDVVFEDERDNRTSIETISTFSFYEETTSTFSWSLTESIDVGIRSSIAAPLPAGFKFETESSINIGLSSTQQHEDSTTRYWSREEQVTVPAQTLIRAKMTIMQEKYDMDFAADVTITGYVAIWLKDKRDVRRNNGSKHWLWFIPVSRVFQDRPVAGFTVLANGAVTFKARGRFKGVQGFKCIIRFDEYKYSPSDLPGERQLGPALKSWEELVAGYSIQPASQF
jgi:hypothetical protein